jgi:ATP-dependent Clp protease ATP-binding subunit ClpX
LESIVEQRIGKKTLGFGAEVKAKAEKDINKLFQEVRPEDLIKFGLIPEFVGRLPIVVSLNQLDEDELIRILTEPRNALVKQYVYLMDLDGVELLFEPEALKLIAKQSMQRRSGARGLRSIIEKLMLDTMFDLPSRSDVAQCLITAKAVNGEEKPQLLHSDEPVRKPRTIRHPEKAAKTINAG